MTLTTEQIESEWKKMQQYERDHFGLKFGDDFGQLANLLRQSKQFMQLGGIISLLAAIEMSGIKKELDESSDKDSVAQSLLERPSGTHNSLAEMFYLGYRLGKQDREIENLQTMIEKGEK